MKKIIILFLVVFIAGFGFGVNLTEFKGATEVTADDLVFEEQDATIRAISRVKPAVVSIEVYGDQEVTTFDLINDQSITRMKKVQKGRGTGFLISADGFIITNKHVSDVVLDESASYQIILNSGKKYHAQMIGRDKLNDLAVLKIFDKDLPYIEMGDSDALTYGSSVIAIGNSMGRYSNSVTKGIVSGIGRDLVATASSGKSENLFNVIQTDAEINLGNSGGPLINLKGEVVGINVAIDESGTAIGFSIPINDARVVIDSVRERGRIVRPRLGIRYLELNEELARENNLTVDQGAWIVSSDSGDSAVVSHSPAERAGLKENDVIVSINGVNIDEDSGLSSIVQKYSPGDKILLKFVRGEERLEKEVELDEFK